MQVYDLDKIKKYITQELEKLEKNCNDEQVSDNIKILSENINTQFDNIEDTKRIILEPAIQQQFYYTWAGYLAVPDERKGYFLCLALRSIYKMDTITNILKEHYGDKYKKVMHELDEHFRIIGEIRNTIDTIQEDSKIRNNINHPTMKRYFKLCQQIPLIYDLPFNVLGVILEKTNLGTMKANQNAIRIYEQTYKKVEYTKEEQTRQKQIRERAEE